MAVFSKKRGGKKAPFAVPRLIKKHGAQGCQIVWRESGPELWLALQFALAVDPGAESPILWHCLLL